MRYIYNLAAILLGLIFNLVAWNYFFHFFSMPPEPPSSPAAQFLGAMIPVGYFAFVKVIEITGGLLVIFPKTRNAGLVALCPVIINILCFHILLKQGEGLFGPPLIVAILALILLFEKRRAFIQLLRS